MSVGRSPADGESSRPDPAQSVVVSGNPTDVELAAAVAAVVAAVSATAPTAPSAGAPTGPGSGWAAYWRSLRAPLPPGRDAWRASGQPRSAAT